MNIKLWLFTLVMSLAMAHSQVQAGDSREIINGFLIWEDGKEQYEMKVCQREPRADTPSTAGLTCIDIDLRHYLLMICQAEPIPAGQVSVTCSEGVSPLKEPEEPRSGFENDK